MKALITVIAISTALVSCGKKSEIVYGTKGIPGQSCHSDSVPGGVNITCGDNVTFIADGAKGDTGQDGAKGDTGDTGSFNGYLEYRVVCESISTRHHHRRHHRRHHHRHHRRRHHHRRTQYKETLLYLDGQYLAFLSSRDYKKQRMVILKENVRYTTSDGRGVHFMITNSQIHCL